MIADEFGDAFHGDSQASRGSQASVPTRLIARQYTRGPAAGETRARR